MLACGVFGVRPGYARYADDYERGHNSNAHIFDEHFRAIEGHAARMPFMAVAGNHEAQYVGRSPTL